MNGHFQHALLLSLRKNMHYYNIC